MGLCFRCEERALVMEGAHGPRYECGCKNASVGSCYMFKPVKPVITAPLKGYEDRPRLAPIALCARESMIKVSECKLAGKMFGTGVCLFWKPTAEKKSKKTKELVGVKKHAK